MPTFPQELRSARLAMDTFRWMVECLKEALEDHQRTYYLGMDTTMLKNEEAMKYLFWILKSHLTEFLPCSLMILHDDSHLKIHPVIDKNHRFSKTFDFTNYPRTFRDAVGLPSTAVITQIRFWFDLGDTIQFGLSRRLKQPLSFDSCDQEDDGSMADDELNSDMTLNEMIKEEVSHQYNSIAKYVVALKNEIDAQLVEAMNQEKPRLRNISIPLHYKIHDPEHIGYLLTLLQTNASRFADCSLRFLTKISQHSVQLINGHCFEPDSPKLVLSLLDVLKRKLWNIHLECNLADCYVDNV